MWTIIFVEDNGTQYKFLTNTEYVVGRKDAHILVPNDASISRKHAVFMVTHPDTNISQPHKPPVLTLQDVSKLGTTVNGVGFKGKSTAVNNGDIITFGTQGTSRYKAVYEQFIVTTSCIAGPFKKAVKSLIIKLGGHAVSEWRKECQMLVMSNLSVTVKVICALVSLRPIVTPQYLEDYISSCENNTECPCHDNYLPPLAESQLDPEMVSFKPNKVRQTLFLGKIFIFLSPKQFKKLNIVIELAGGTPMLMEEGTDNNEDDILISPNTCVMSCDQMEATQMSQNAQQWIDHVMQFLNRNQKRPISDPEIGYAILYCSLEKYCNPNSDVAQPVANRPPLVPQSLSQIPVQLSEQHEVLAPETEMDTTATHRRIRTRNCSKSDITHVDETKIDLQIKHEPLSQPGIQGTSGAPYSPATKKRHRDNVNETLSNEPQSKRHATDKQIKHEPITPRKPIVAEFAASPAKSTRSHSRSPSPGPRENKINPKTETVEFENFDFDSIPTRKSRRRASEIKGNSNEQNHEYKEQKIAPPVFKADPETIQSKNSDLENEIQDDFDAIPTGRSRKKNIANSKDNIPKKSQNNKPENVLVRDGGSDVAMDNEKVQVYSRITAGSNQSEKNKVKQSEDTDVIKRNLRGRVKEEFPDALDSDIPSMTQRGGNLEGFLCAKKPIESHHARISEFSVKEEGLPCNCVMIEEKSLLARKPGQTKERPRRVDGNTANWKGKQVKNFKKFKKVNHTGHVGLPTIIGGSDLVLHESKPREEIEEWFREEMQVESQNNEIEKLAKEMFEWEPPSKRRRP